MAEQDEKARGEVKEKLGEVMGDEELERQGRADQSKAELKEAAEEAKSGLSEAAERLKDTAEDTAEKAKGAFNK